MDKENGNDHQTTKDDQKEAISLARVNVISTISDLAKNLSKQDENLESSINNLPTSLKKQSPSSNETSSKSFLNNYDLNNQDVVDVMPKAMSFTWFDILLNLVSIFCYLIDVVSDIITCYVHFQTKSFVFFYLTLIFIIVPTLITTFISLRWYAVLIFIIYFYLIIHFILNYFKLRYIVDAKNESASPYVSKTRWTVRGLFLFFQMGQIMRYIDSLAFGIKYMNKPDVKYYRYMIHEDTDATMLRLFECFLESAPQLLIQLYLIIMVPIDTGNLSNQDLLFYGIVIKILIYKFNFILKFYFFPQVLFPYFSCCISLFSIALALASYYKSLRMSLPNKVNLSMFVSINT